MSGHSKWANIKRKKEKTDAAKAKVFTRIGKEMAVAIRAGGPNPNNNSKLRDLIAKAKANNVPNENIERTIKKFSDDNSVNYEELTYEGYGAAGVAIIVETATDNKNRTAGNIRSYFSKFHGNMGQTGCVSFMFSERGLIEISDDEGEIEEDKLMEDALEAGAADFEGEDGFYSIYTEVADVQAVADALISKGYKLESADRALIPSTYVEVTDEEDVKMLELLLEKLDDDDDVQNVFHNWEN